VPVSQPEFWQWSAKESTRWFQADVPVEAEEQWDVAHDIVWGRPLPDPISTLEYRVVRGRLDQQADVINTWNVLPDLVGPRFVAAFREAGLTGARLAPALVFDEKRGEQTADYQVLVPTAVIGRRLWTQDDHVGGDDDTGEMRQFLGYPIAPETWQGEDFVRVDGTGWRLISRRAFDALAGANLKGLDLTSARDVKLFGFPKDYAPW
jgi:hypothetical protein